MSVENKRKDVDFQVRQIERKDGKRSKVRKEKSRRLNTRKALGNHEEPK